MDYNRITSLLDKYWECATTIEEERELRHFFSSDALPPELRPYKAWFLTPEAETLPPLGKEFDLKVLQQITREKKLRRLRRNGKRNHGLYHRNDERKRPGRPIARPLRRLRHDNA